MKASRILASAAALVVSATACHGDFLTGGELSNDPNNPTVAGIRQYFVGVQSNVFYTYSGDLVRMAGIFAQHFYGANQQYIAIDQYNIDEGTVNGQQRQLYGPGGLVDVRKLEAGAAQVKDSLFLGIGQVMEAMLMGVNTDVFGDVVYSHALTGEANPPLDPQLAVYDSLQVLLSRAIVNMSATGPSNVGPQGADLVYGGAKNRWIPLAHTLKARYYMHTAEVRGTAAYAAALAEAQLGIASAGGDYHGVFSGAQAGETNPWNQFVTVQRVGYLIPGRILDTLLRSRHDPRRRQYFQVDSTATVDSAVNLSAARLAPTYPQPFVTAEENWLILAEAAYRTGNLVTALSALNAERAIAGLSAVSLSGSALLQGILTEKYVADFQLGVEGWKDYRRTCFPNLPNRSLAALQMPGRLYYDQDERRTDTSIPAPGISPNGLRNAVDPSNATADAVGGVCVAGA